MRHFLCVHHLSDGYALFTKIPILCGVKHDLTHLQSRYGIFAKTRMNKGAIPLTTPNDLLARKPCATGLTHRIGLERKSGGTSDLLH